MSDEDLKKSEWLKWLTNDWVHLVTEVRVHSFVIALVLILVGTILGVVLTR